MCPSAPGPPVPCPFLLFTNLLRGEGPWGGKHTPHHTPTGDAPGNVDFYTRVLGLRMVAKTVNQDDPTVYHLFYADERGRPGSELTFFEYPGAIPGRAGAGMVHRIVWRVASSRP